MVQLSSSLFSLSVSFALEAFLELGFLRNCLVHQNFAGYVFEKTNEEVYQLYRQASVFAERVIRALS